MVSSSTNSTSWTNIDIKQNPIQFAYKTQKNTLYGILDRLKGILNLIPDNGRPEYLYEGETNQFFVDSRVFQNPNTSYKMIELTKAYPKGCHINIIDSEQWDKDIKKIENEYKQAIQRMKDNDSNYLKLDREIKSAKPSSKSLILNTMTKIVKHVLEMRKPIDLEIPDGLNQKERKALKDKYGALEGKLRKVENMRDKTLIEESTILHGLIYEECEKIDPMVINACGPENFPEIWKTVTPRTIQALLKG